MRFESACPEDRAIMFKKIPLVVKLRREEDSKGRPFELHIARCAKWSNGLDAAVRTGKSQLEPPSAAQGQQGDSTGPGSPADHWTW